MSKIRVGAGPAQVRGLLADMLTRALTAVDPAIAVVRHVSRKGSILRVGDRRYDLRRYRRVVVVGAGKASAPMARALEQVLGTRVTTGLVVVKYGHGVPTKTIELVEAGHPVPDAAGLTAVDRLRSLLRQQGQDDLVFVLLSGGASSLLPAPASGLTLADKQQTTQLLLKSGATIQEMNTVRKHLSVLKGGQLAAATQAQVIALILSDVIGNDLGTIGSGPTAPDPTTFEDARMVLERYGLSGTIPAAVQAHLSAGVEGRASETPKPGASVFKRVQNLIIGNNEAAVETVANAAKQHKIRPLILSTTLTGEAREAAKMFGAIAREVAGHRRPVQRPCCVIAGGELTVTIQGTGRGGRAQEFALAAAHEIEGLSKVWVVGFATDGTDGPTDVAGAVVDGRTLARARRMQLNPAHALRDNDAFPFFQTLDQHISTGPTGTNVNDLYLLLAL